MQQADFTQILRRLLADLTQNAMQNLSGIQAES